MEVLLDTCGRRSVRSLLILYFFVMKAAADCPKPQGRGNLVLTNAALLMNDFPEGVNVALECANGYEPESGSGIITCIDSNWTEPDLSCKKRDCGLPRPQPHMSFNTSSGTLFGAVIRVICDKGFRLTGSSYKQCYPSGWSGKAKCNIVTCGKPDDMANGRSSWDSQDDPKYGEMIQYVCNEGYTLIGKASIVCSENGAYDSQPPTCEGVATEDTVTTTMVTPTSTLTTQDPPTTPTAHRDTFVTTSPTPTVSPSVQGGREVLTAEGKATTTSVTSMTSSSVQGMHNGTIDTNKDIGYIPVIISVICVSLAVCIVAIFLHKYLLRRKGSANGTVPIY